MSNAQKLAYGKTQNIHARQKAWDQIQKTGRSLPVSVVSADGAIITVNFEVLSDFTLQQIAVPLFGPQYIRYPIQPGDLGIVIAVDAQIGAMCGLGTGTADLAQPANLGALVFLPIGNKDWDAVDPDALVLQGKNGTVLQDMDGKSTDTLTPTDRTVNVTDGDYTLDVSNGNVTLTASDTFTIQVGSHAIVINSSGISIDGVMFLPHTHTGGTIAGDTGPVIP